MNWVHLIVIAAVLAVSLAFLSFVAKKYMK
ncbi:hypothetical protein PM3016_961 [Paenibacillus mucilaginosus 3016]|uniref:Uncharacterized protein n=1 Tax=Paenibacillus mucilaginosus 3016 TaxID=1116391 RepID=H6NBV1_9BACL|nr:hypothetical protein PM3016_961 [Paenibacillus mucilaginosus 3016]